VLPEDLHKFGLIPEFIGRLPVVTTVTPLDQVALMEILTKPKNALVRQYQRMFELDNVELDFDEDALEAIADLAVLRQTGARGLRAIMEEVLGPIMFDVPSDDQVARVVVTRAAVLENAAPTIVPPSSSQPRCPAAATRRNDKNAGHSRCTAVFPPLLRAPPRFSCVFVVERRRVFTAARASAGSASPRMWPLRLTSSATSF
jgi:hypothetical protein